MKKGKPRIAIAQIEYYDIHKYNNVEKIKRYIRLAAKKKADIICFPESCVYKIETLRSDDKFLKEIKSECRKNSIWCVITENFILRGKEYNMAVLINREGRIAGTFKKIHLFEDTENLNAGKKPRVFKTDFGKIGIVICWDLAFPELFRKMKGAGAEIVFCPAQWSYEKKAHKEHHLKRERKILQSILLSRAFENLFFVALVSPVMKNTKDLVSYSAICSPHRILKEIAGKEGLGIAELNLHEIKKFEKIYPR